MKSIRHASHWLVSGLVSTAVTFATAVSGEAQTSPPFRNADRPGQVASMTSAVAFGVSGAARGIVPAFSTDRIALGGGMGLQRPSQVLVVVSLASLLFNAVLALALARCLLAGRRCERLLRRVSEPWATALSRLGEAVVVTDPKGQVVLLNQAAESLSGRTSPDAEGQAAASAGAMTIGGQELLLTGSGTSRPVEKFVSPLRGPRGEPAGAVIVLREKHPRVEPKANPLEDERVKDEFLSMLSHELRNPLASILSASEIIGIERLSPDGSVAQEIVGREVRHLAGMLNSMMALTTMSRGPSGVHKQLTDAVAIIHRAIRLVEPVVEARKQSVEPRIGETRLRLLADASGLEQVIVELLRNASQFSPPGSRIQVRARRDRDQIVIQVVDHGTGIARDVLPRVFELFSQGERTLDRRQGGLGIGLTIVKRLAELHGGSVSASSDGPGKGSTFTVQLPAAKESEMSVAAPVSAPGAPEDKQGKTRILIVDDNKDLASSLARLLRLQGHEVEVVHDGHKGLEAARTYRPRVVLLDIGLPNLDGYQVARTLRQEGFNETMIIAVSGYGQEEDRKRSQEAGMDYHLTKPVDVRTIAELIAQPT